MSAGMWLVVAFIAYWIGVWLWIKGTDPLSHGIFHWIWALLKIVLICCTGLIILAALFGSPRED